MDLSVDYKQAKTKSEAFSIAREVITPEYIAKYKVSPDIEYREDECVIEAVGKGFTLTLIFEEDRCDVKIKLSLVLRALKRKILEGVERKLERHV